ncbi:hypothetical protein PUR50_26325, partial [Enterobacter hormaechei subsp. steigerwaltii]|nr:hypothetical protein [Enterobacter hormaechei subsp. steigerwaltii]
TTRQTRRIHTASCLPSQRSSNRAGATVLQGNPEEVRELIDATPFAKKYTSGVLSFAEKELPPGGREKVMASFER